MRQKKKKKRIDKVKQRNCYKLIMAIAGFDTPYDRAEE